jgi:hypothetical protein
MVGMALEMRIGGKNLGTKIGEEAGTRCCMAFVEIRILFFLYFSF